jgi:hypothetical protein
MVTFAFQCTHLRPVYAFMALRKADIMGSSLQDFVYVEILWTFMFDFIYKIYDFYLRFYCSVLSLKVKSYSCPPISIIIVIIISFAKLRELCPEMYLKISCLLVSVFIL